MAKKQGYFLYKIYYSDELVYLGRTKQSLEDRLRAHVLKKPMVREIDIDLISKVEFAEFETVADMYLYEVYLINLLKPPLNKDDKAKDHLTFQLPEVPFLPFSSKLWDSWMEKKKEKTSLYEQRRARLSEIQKEISELRRSNREGKIKTEEFESKYDALADEKTELKRLLK